jgi:hypothetical protein
VQSTTAVVQVSDDGTATLYLGTEPVEHANGVDAATVMRVLVDYAATIDAGLQITTQMPDGTWTRHRLDSNGTLTPLPRNRAAAESTHSSGSGGGLSRSSRPTVWSRIGTRVAARAWLVVVVTLLVAALVAVLVTT